MVEHAETQIPTTPMLNPSIIGPQRITFWINPAAEAYRCGWKDGIVACFGQYCNILR